MYVFSFLFEPLTNLLFKTKTKCTYIGQPKYTGRRARLHYPKTDSGYR